MSPIAVAWLLVAVFTAMGILLWIVARPMAKLSVWCQSLLNRLPVVQSLSKFMLDEGTSVVLMRVLGVFFIVFGILGSILAIALPYMQLPAR